jgi:hypothetical protein
MNTNPRCEEHTTSDLFRGIGAAVGAADGFVRGTRLTSAPVKNHFFRPMASEVFLQQIFPQLRDPSLSTEARHSIIIALSRRLHCEASRYAYLPHNWWKMEHIFESRRLYESLINYGLMHKIVLPETTW